MSKSQKVISCIAIWLISTLMGGCIGSKWAWRDIPSGESGVGDGIGLLLYGGLGLFYGAVVGLIIVLLIFFLVPRIRSNRL